MMISPRPVTAILLALVPLALAAQAPPFSSEFRAITYTTGNQSSPAITSAGDGSFVAVWGSPHDGGPGGGVTGVFGQRFDDSGAKDGPEFQVNTYTTDQQAFASVVADSTGNFVVVWTSMGQDGSGPGVFGQRFDSGGSKIGLEFRANAYTPGNQSPPSVAGDSEGNFVVVWASDGQDGSARGVFGQRFNSSGSKVGPEFPVNSYTPDSQSDPSVAFDSEGNFVVVWTSDDQDGSVSGVFGQRFDSSGSKVGPEFQVNTYTPSFQRYPSVAPLGAGSFVVV